MSENDDKDEGSSDEGEVVSLSFDEDEEYPHTLDTIPLTSPALNIVEVIT